MESPALCRAFRYSAQTLYIDTSCWRHLGCSPGQLVCLLIIFTLLLKWRTMTDGNNLRPIHNAYFWFQCNHKNINFRKLVIKSREITHFLKAALNVALNAFPSFPDFLSLWLIFRITGKFYYKPLTFFSYMLFWICIWRKKKTTSLKIAFKIWWYSFENFNFSAMAVQTLVVGNYTC